jgi:uncharacterized membrane protein YozB (DUF420 family)
MQQGHQAHGGMSRDMMCRHYLTFGLNMILSTIIMYLVMFEMIRGWEREIDQMKNILRRL